MSSWLRDHAVMQSVAKQHLLRAQERMKRQADKHRSERQFQVGDFVYLKPQPYIQTSLAPRSNQKLAFKFFGPFRIIGRVGAVAYKLELPPESAVHPVFHVSQLKQAIGNNTASAELLPDTAAIQYPDKILQRRMSEGNKPVLQGLVKWSGMPASLATWENLEAPRHRFPGAPTWGQVATQGEGLSAVHHHQGSPSTQQKPIAGPRELLGPVRVCVAQNGVREWCI
jgi:hypothetical protein